MIQKFVWLRRLLILVAICFAALVSFIYFQKQPDELSLSCSFKGHYPMLEVDIADQIENRSLKSLEPKSAHPRYEELQKLIVVMGNEQKRCIEKSNFKSCYKITYQNMRFSFSPFATGSEEGYPVTYEIVKPGDNLEYGLSMSFPGCSFHEPFSAGEYIK